MPGVYLPSEIQLASTQVLGLGIEAGLILASLSAWARGKNRDGGKVSRHRTTPKKEHGNAGGERP